MHTFFYSNISEFSGSLEGMIDEGTYKTTIQNMHKLGCKEKSSSPLMFRYCVMVVVFNNILSFMTELKKNQMLPIPYVGSYSDEKGHQFLH